MIGVKSLAIYFGHHTRQWLYGFSSVMALSLFYAGINSSQTIPYYLGATFMCGSLVHLVSMGSGYISGFWNFNGCCGFF